MASRAKTARYDVSIKVKDAIEQGEWAEVTQILSKCSSGDWESIAQHVFPHFADNQSDAMLIHIVTRGEWRTVDWVLHRGVSTDRHNWAVEECSRTSTSDDFLEYALHHCADDQLDSVLTHLVTRGEWKAVDRVLHRGVNKEFHTWAVEKCSEKANSDDFRDYALPHCADNQLESVLTHLVTRSKWKAVDEVLRRGVNKEFHTWAVEKCSEKANSDDFVKYAFPHCNDDQLDSVLTHLVTRGESRTVFRCVNEKRYRLAVEVCSKSATSDDFMKYALPHCADDQLNSVLTHLVRRGKWKAVDWMLRRVVSNAYRRLVVEECSKTATSDDFIEYALHHCGDDQFESVLTHFVRRGKWKAVDKVLDRDVRNAYQKSTVVECSKTATSDDFIEYVLHHCADNQLDSVLTHLVTRGEWKAVDRVLHRGVSNVQHNWAVEECSKKARQDDFIEYVLHHCADNQLDSVLTHLVTQCEWKAVDRVLHRGVSNVQHNWAVKECSKKARQDDFIEYVLHHCADDQLDFVLTHLIRRNLWKAVSNTLHQSITTADDMCKICPINYHNPEDMFLRYVRPGDYAIVLPFMVEHGKHHLVGIVLDKVVASSLHRWVTGTTRLSQGDDEASLDDVDNCHVDVMFTLRLFKAVVCLGNDGPARRNKLGLKNDLYRVLYMSLMHNMCVALCSDHNSLNNVNDSVDSCVPEIYLKIQSCVSNIPVGCSVKAIIDEWKNQDRTLLSEQLGISKHSSISTNVFFQFLQQFNLYYRNRRGGNDDDILLTIFAVLPLFPELQSEALRIMLRHKRWDVLSHAYVSRAWEQDRRQLLKAAVKQKQWKVVRKWADHALYDDQRVWALNEALNEKQWDVALLLADHGLTVIELMQVRYRVAKYADWDVVLRIFQRGGDVAEISERLGRMREGKRISENVKKNIARTHIKALKLETEMREKTHKDWDVILTMFERGNNVAEIAERLVRMRKEKSNHEIAKRNIARTHIEALKLETETQNKTHKDWDIILTMFEQGDDVAQIRERLGRMREEKRIPDNDKSNIARTHIEAQRLETEKREKRHKDWDVILTMFEQGDNLAQIRERLERMREEKGIQENVRRSIACTRIEPLKLQTTIRKKHHKDWNIILTMFKRGGDVAEIAKRLVMMREEKRIPENVARRHIEALKLETRMRKKQHKDLRKYCQESNWTLVLYSLVRCPSETSLNMALKAAVTKKAWHVVIQLVRLGMDTAQRDSFFSRMIRRRKWGVCRALLEQRLSVQVCLDALPHLMEMNQWTLVARVMEHEVDDVIRQQVMQRAWERREGSVVWLCIKSSSAPLSVDQREALFQKALSFEIWQVIKPLIEEKDETGIRHRDTALLEAIEQHQWDVVDHCQRHHADINMKDDDDHTPIHRAARKRDWEAVKELTVRDGDPNLLDSEGLSVLHRTIIDQQWELVKLVIQFHGDIHKKVQHIQYHRGYRGTPLQMLINARQGEVIESSLMWCPGQQKVVNDKGETVLHAVCLSGWPGALYHLVARKVDPLAVTERRLTALCYAVLCKDCPQRMVAECIQMGFSTHQPHITDNRKTAGQQLDKMLRSPVVLAVMRGLPVVTQMLYESGACSNRELLNVHFDQLTKCNTDTGRTFRSAFWGLWNDVHNGSAGIGYSFDSRLMRQSADYLHQVSSTPRSLVSTCRLVISRCLTLSKTRHRDIAQLPLWPRMKDYLMFSDLTDPSYPDLLYSGKA